MFCNKYFSYEFFLVGGKLGKPIHIDDHFHANLVTSEDKWHDSRIVSPSSGMTSIGIHAVGMFINLFGRTRDVQARSKRVENSIDVDECTLVRINFENGCTGHLTSLSATNMMWRISAFCLGGWVEMRDQDELEVSLISDGNSIQKLPGYDYPALTTIKAALETFAGDVAEVTPFPISPAKIEHSTAVLDAIIQSVKTGNTVFIT